LQVAVEAALRADIDQIQAHIRVAIKEGASHIEVLEAMQCVIMPMGALAYRRVLQAWSAETGIGLEN
jgi:alkylhydroperoxidase/carboxymuconolactone decarboxylase family protein YurZ